MSGCWRGKFCTSTGFNLSRRHVSGNVGLSLFLVSKWKWSIKIVINPLVKIALQIMSGCRKIKISFRFCTSWFVIVDVYFDYLSGGGQSQLGM